METFWYISFLVNIVCLQVLSKNVYLNLDDIKGEDFQNTLEGHETSL